MVDITFMVFITFMGDTQANKVYQMGVLCKRTTAVTRFPAVFLL